MAVLTTIDKVKLVTRDDANIQALVANDPAVTQALNDADLLVPSGFTDEITELMQRYLCAHLLSLAFQAVGGQGPLSSESIGGVTQSFTLPYLNQKTVYGSTQYGLHYLDLLAKFRIGPRVVTVGG